MTNFRMLIGDDAFKESRTAEDYILLMLCEMKKTNGYAGRLSAVRVSDGWCRPKVFPIQGFEGADIRIEDNVEAMIEAGNIGEYDWVVSDLDYGKGRTEGGLEVFRSVVQKPGVVRAIFTSGDDIAALNRMREQSRNLGVDYFITPYLAEAGEEKRLHKTDVLARTIARHYQKLKGGNEK